MSAPATEALLAAAYAVVLLGVALALEWSARHSHRRSERYRTAGFDFHAGHDAWICPEGEHLKRADVDHHRRLVRYRARAHVCNACPAKGGCTDSDEGREVVQPMDPWPHSEAGRFHRGVSVALLCLACLILAIELIRNNQPADVAVLALAFTPIAIALPRLFSVFRSAPTTEPGPVVGADEAGTVRL